jgi:hypothetical protein
MAGGARVSCVVGDAFMSMAAEAGVPWVAVWTGGPCALLAHIMGDAIRKDIGNDGIYDFITNPLYFFSFAVAWHVFIQ